VKDEVQSTITSQLDAFLKDDFASAFEYASPSIQRMFRNPDNFGMMVQRGYPMVWRPAKSRFLEFAQDQRGPYQLIEITDSNGRVHTLRYDMLETPAGWRIRGVQVLPGTAFSS
jgi:YD repeat-containing protein